MNIEEFAGMIDHTDLRPFVTREDLKKLCLEARKYHFKMVAINSVQTEYCHNILRGTGVHTGAAIGFPLGQQTISTKLFETREAIINGADEIDYVINITELKEKNYDYIEKEMDMIVNECRFQNVISKIIFENCYLTKEEIITLSKLALIHKPDYIKTSTGFGTSGATVEDVELMKRIVGNVIGIKAAGGIRTYEKALDMLKAGASRIGTSHSLDILREGFGVN